MSKSASDTFYAQLCGERAPQHLLYFTIFWFFCKENATNCDKNCNRSSRKLSFSGARKAALRLLPFRRGGRLDARIKLIKGKQAQKRPEPHAERARRNALHEYPA